jgi:hypothetical protein
MEVLGLNRLSKEEKQEIQGFLKTELLEGI